MSGYYGHYDKHLEHQDQSTLGKIQQQYWKTKQHVIQKLGKKEDEFVVLSDAELDAKLELFKAIKQNSNDLLKIIEHYQEKLCQLSQEEAEMAQFLKEFSQYDKTRAGKMMSSVAKAQNFSAQQRLTLRLPLARLYNEVETFRYRAITDTWLNVRKMETARTEYRGALLWMKNISQELDPDTYKKLEKFRRVQSQVKTTKTKFDRVKCDVIQKIDLLLASRCNMFSHVLVLYQQSLINFWLKASKTMNAIADTFKGYQYYEFNIIKDLVEPNKRLANQNSSHDLSDLSENEKKIVKNNDETDNENDNVDEIFDLNKSKSKDDNNDDSINEESSSLKNNENNSLKVLYNEIKENENFKIINNVDINFNLIEFDEKNEKENRIKEEEEEEKLNENLDSSLIDLKTGYNEEDVNELIDMMTTNEAKDLNEQLKELELLQKLKQTNNSKVTKQQEQIEFENEFTSTIIDDNLFKNSNDEFEKEWQSAFTSQSLINFNNSSLSPKKLSNDNNNIVEDLLNLNNNSTNNNQNFLKKFLPSQLLTSSPSSNIKTDDLILQPQNISTKQQIEKQDQHNKTISKNTKKDMSTWYNLFADLDPLQNPDAIGDKKDIEEERNC